MTHQTFEEFANLLEPLSKEILPSYKTAAYLMDISIHIINTTSLDSDLFYDNEDQIDDLLRKQYPDLTDGNIEFIIDCIAANLQQWGDIVKPWDKFAES